MNCDAERFGLKQGDLSTASGRRCLYDRLLLKQPRHIWMSPRCKAWCRWNQFNMTKTPELANRIMKDRLEDIVHLLLCDAFFQFQQWRHPECHAHLEQPDGSHMPKGSGIEKNQYFPMFKYQSFWVSISCFQGLFNIDLKY